MVYVPPSSFVLKLSHLQIWNTKKRERGTFLYEFVSIASSVNFKTTIFIYYKCYSEWSRNGLSASSGDMICDEFAMLKNRQRRRWKRRNWYKDNIWYNKCIYASWWISEITLQGENWKKTSSSNQSIKWLKEKLSSLYNNIELKFRN